MIKYFKINEVALDEMLRLLEASKYHVVSLDDNGDYFTVFMTNDNGNMKEEDIDDRFFDLELVDTEEEKKLDKFLTKKELKDVGELINYVGYLEDVKKDYEFLKSEMLKTANNIKNLY